MIKTRVVIYCILITILPFKILGQNIALLLREAQQFETAFNDQQALQTYSEILRYQPLNLVALCKSSELHNLLGKRQPTKQKQKEYYESAKNFAQQALRINPNYSEANVAMAMSLGRMALMSSGHEKIKAVKDIKTYADRCVQIDPSNYKGYHILGKWHYEISDLNSFERWLVKITYGSLPNASLDESIRNYEKSRQLNPGFILNYLELAKAYKRNDEEKKARELIHTMMQLPNSSSDDGKIKGDGLKLLKQME